MIELVVFIIVVCVAVGLSRLLWRYFADVVVMTFFYDFKDRTDYKERAMAGLVILLHQIYRRLDDIREAIIELQEQ
jgi:hypothetical protein